MNPCVGRVSRLPVLHASCAQSNTRLEAASTGRQDACPTVAARFMVPMHSKNERGLSINRYQSLVPWLRIARPHPGPLPQERENGRPMAWNDERGPRFMALMRIRLGGRSSP